jgi:hypothetical protein
LPLAHPSGEVDQEAARKGKKTNMMSEKHRYLLAFWRIYWRIYKRRCREEVWFAMNDEAQRLMHWSVK